MKNLTPTPPNLTPTRWRRFVPIALIVLGLLLISWYGVRTARSYWQIQQTGLQPGVTDVTAIRGWMTVPYIAKAFGVPADYIFEQLQIPPTDNHDKSLRQLNRQYASDQPGLIVQQVQAALRAYQSQPPAATRAKP